MKTPKLRVVLADDEKLARNRVRRLLGSIPDLEVVAEAGDGEQALELISEHAPDLVFLDVQMPGASGIDVLRAMPAGRCPEVILVTAFDRYAIQAFEAEALDYVLKPVDPDRLAQAVGRARRRLEERRRADPETTLARIEERLSAHPRYAERFAVRRGSRIVMVPVHRIDYVQADGNYARLHVGDQDYLLRKPMKGLEECLDPRKFMRIHRSTIINVCRVAVLEPWFHGEYTITLTSGATVRSSRSYTDRVRTLLELS